MPPPAQTSILILAGVRIVWHNWMYTMGHCRIHHFNLLQIQLQAPALLMALVILPLSLPQSFQKQMDKIHANTVLTASVLCA